MEIQVLIEPVLGNGYRARTFGITAEGATEEEAVAKLRQLIHDQLNTGTRILQLKIPDPDSPWQRLQGVYKDDLLFDEWQQAIADYRQQVEEDPDAR